ncbi:hypothetical protein NECAME_02017 [Necator americanus]|uniref:Uncharacterized protein n=1 Tax=Necator americanus TaxID=51031 RepID=W2TJN8_NECAM|nr:hypothetical protein NECAME_02017 [Necator americanus]ETN82280.1 hypothetical protein NECAME_02017 [Necator americanus]
MHDSSKNKRSKSRTLGQLMEQQRAEDVELPHPSGASLAVQMTQGLMSNDVLKLDTVLRESRLEVIQLRNLETELSGLLEWMRQRVGHQQKLIELYGRLSIVGEQIERRINRTVVVAPQPLIVFNDDVDSDLEEIESGGSEESGASSDEEEEDWWDEEGIGAVDDKDEDDEESDDDSDDDMPARIRACSDDSGTDDSEDSEKNGNDVEESDEEMDIG